MRIGIVGRTRWLLDAARAAVAAGHEPVFVYTCRTEAYYGVGEADFERLAAELGVPFFNGLTIMQDVERLRALGADVCLSANWITVLREPLLSAFPYGLLNAHAGDLPRYKGNACPNWALLNFEPRIGLTIHRMTEDLDSGPYLLKKFLTVDETTYIGEVYDWLDRTVPLAFVEALGRLPQPGFVEQDTSVRTLRTFPRRPEDGRIDWTRSRRDVLALVRASSHPFDGAFAFLEDEPEPVRIFRARAFDPGCDVLAVPGQVCMRTPLGRPIVAAADGLLELEECRFGDLEGDDAFARIHRSLRNRLR